MSYATGFQIATDDPNLDLSSIDKEVSRVIEKQEFIAKELPKAQIQINERKEIINEILRNDKKEIKELDHDLFYQDLLHFNDQKLKNKYLFLSDKLIKRLKLALEVK